MPTWGSSRGMPCPKAPPTHLQHEGGEEVEGGDAEEEQLEMEILNALELQQGFGKAQRVQGQPDHHAKEQDEDQQEEHCGERGRGEGQEQGVGGTQWHSVSPCPHRWCREAPGRGGPWTWPRPG